MAWANATPDDLKRNQGQEVILAVINDHQEVLFLNISSSTELKGKSTKVLGHHEHVPGGKTSRQTGYEISWSSWIAGGNASQAVVSYRMGGCSSTVIIDLKISQVRQLRR